MTSASASSKFKAQRNRSKCVWARLLADLASSPDAHHDKPYATPGNDPLAAGAEGCLPDPRSPADMMTAQTGSSRARNPTQGLCPPGALTQDHDLIRPAHVYADLFTRCSSQPSITNPETTSLNEIDRTLRQLRLSRLAATLSTRVPEAQTTQPPLLDTLSAICRTNRTGAATDRAALQALAPGRAPDAAGL